MSNFLIITTISVLVIFIIGLFILYRIKKKDKTEISKKIPEYQQIIRLFNEELDARRHEYISHRQYEGLNHKFKGTARVINALPKKIRTKYGFNKFLTTYRNLKKVIDALNDEYVKHELQVNADFFNNISGKSLDEQQRLVCVTDEDNSLVIAGAGSGKTLTLEGKISYLVERKSVNQEDILLISFSNKITSDLKNRIGVKYPGINISTFHSLGLNIIRDNEQRTISVADDSLLGNVIYNYLSIQKDTNPDTIYRIIEFFNSYFQTGKGHEKESDKNVEKYQTICCESVKSLAEVEIANFLYLHSIDYRYEELYKFSPADKPYHPDFYLPEYDIYLEHFGIDKDGHAPQLGKEDDEKYRKQIRWKRNIHKENKTTLIETYSYYESDGTLLTKLEELLKEHKIPLKYRNPEELMSAFTAISLRKEFSNFRKLIISFISLYKSGGYTNLPKHTLSQSLILLPPFQKKRDKLFLEIVSEIYHIYENELDELNQVDFSDMILKATDIVKNHGDVHNFKYILVDEYQDISVARYKFLYELCKETGAKILCVGDDWQSIYKFTGSDIDLFLNFEKYFPHPKIHKIEKTYRNSQDLLNIISPYIMSNPSQIQKTMVSEMHSSNPIRIIQYDKIMLEQLSSIIESIVHDVGENASVLILGRTNSDLSDNITSTNLGSDFSVKRMKAEIIISSKKHPLVKISPMTVHKSKGLEADAVIILNMSNNLLGFPNRLTDDPILSLVSQNPETYPFAEERRVFYVAVTRAKKIVYLLTPKSAKKQSTFLKEVESIMNSQSRYKNNV